MPVLKVLNKNIIFKNLREEKYEKSQRTANEIW